MLEVRVNLHRLESLENCVRNNNLSIRGSHLRKLESFARREHTGVVKKRYRHLRNADYHGHPSSSSEHEYFTRDASRSRKTLKRRNKKRREINPSGDEETSSSMSKDEMEKDLKEFVDKHRLPEKIDGPSLDERLEQVKEFLFNGHKSFNGYTNGSGDLLNGHNGFRNLSQLKKELVPTKEEVESLARQVETLKRELEDKMRRCTYSESESEEEDEVVRQLQAQLSKTVALNSVIFTKSMGSTETIAADEDTVLIHRVIEGCTGTIPFTLQILIQRNKSSTGPVEDACVVDLDVSIPKNSYVQKELEPFIEKMRNCRDVMLCIRGLEKYATWYLLRQKAFKHFTTNKPLVASLGADKLEREMLLKNPNDNIRATVIWTFDVEETGHLTPVISLRVQKTVQAVFADEDNVISKLPSMFQLMLELYGIERAITIVIDMMSM